MCSLAAPPACVQRDRSRRLVKTAKIQGKVESRGRVVRVQHKHTTHSP